MKVLLINGSPRKKGNTNIALSEIAKTLESNKIKTEIVHIGTKPMQGCIACYKCLKTGVCRYDDKVYKDIINQLQDADGIIIGSPVYYGGPNGSLCALLDRIFLANSKILEYKPAAAVVVCRRGGASASFDRLNKYFMMNNMPVVTSQYWNSVHGRDKGEAERDLEGLQTMRLLAQNMIWLLNSTKNQPKPEREDRVWTSFVK